jgi:hypothetical protein
LIGGGVAIICVAAGFLLGSAIPKCAHCGSRNVLRITLNGVDGPEYWWNCQKCHNYVQIIPLQEFFFRPQRLRVR